MSLGGPQPLQQSRLSGRAEPPQARGKPGAGSRACAEPSFGAWKAERSHGTEP